MEKEKSDLQNGHTSIWKRVAPVSYTHLDVYKRQALTLMEPPPKSLSLDMFIDVHDDTLVDKKQTVLTELDSLLKMFEDGLSAIEHTLRNSLPQESPED